MCVCEQPVPRRADSGEMVADARLAVAAAHGPAALPPGLLCSGPYLPPGPRGPPLIPAPLPLALPLDPRALPRGPRAGPSSWAGFIVPPWVPFRAVRAGGAPEAKAAEAEEAEADPPLALRMVPAPPPLVESEPEEEEEEEEPRPKRARKPTNKDGFYKY
jgi:hypothetical protein